jgi:hypothetical protein
LKICSALEIDLFADDIHEERFSLCPTEILKDQHVSTVSDPSSGMQSDYFHNGWVQHRVQCRCGGRTDSDALPL